MKYLSILIALFLFGCNDDHSLEDQLNTSFHYGDEVRIVKGFYKDYTCIVLREYPEYDSIFCQLYGFIEQKEETLVQEKYIKSLKISRANVELVNE